jgi:hypothetical protein
LNNKESEPDMSNNKIRETEMEEVDTTEMIFRWILADAELWCHTNHQDIEVIKDK